MPELDNTYAQVVVDGFNLDAIHVRHFMAQSAMPHLEGRVVALSRRACGQPHFDIGELAFTPHIEHDCISCGATFTAPTQMKKTIGNPFAAVRVALAAGACNPLRNHFRPQHEPARPYERLIYRSAQHGGCLMSLPGHPPARQVRARAGLVGCAHA